jgi:hypothetical protein
MACEAKGGWTRHSVFVINEIHPFPSRNLAKTFSPQIYFVFIVLLDNYVGTKEITMAENEL